MTDLIEKAQAGDVDAFGALYRDHVGRVHALCLRMASDHESARELTQDVFVRCWERIGTFRGESAFSSWLHRLAVNVILEEFRRVKRRDHRIELTEAPERLGTVVPRDLVEERLDLTAAIAALPEGARTVFVLHDIEGYKHQEISEMTGSAPGTLRAQLHRARQLLMKALS